MVEESAGTESLESFPYLAFDPVHPRTAPRGQRKPSSMRRDRPSEYQHDGLGRFGTSDGVLARRNRDTTLCQLTERDTKLSEVVRISGSCGLIQGVKLWVVQQK